MKKDNKMRIKNDSAKQLILIFLFPLLFNGNIYSEEKSPINGGNDKEPVLDFVQGKLNKRYLPFNQSFTIAGSTKINESLNIDAVIAKIRTSKDKEIINDKGEQDIFWTRNDKTETTFSINVDPLPKWKYKYYITLIFCKQIEDILVNKFVDLFTERLKEIFINQKGSNKYQIFDLFKTSFKNIFPANPIYYIREKAISYEAANEEAIMSMLDRELAKNYRYNKFTNLILKQKQTDEDFGNFKTNCEDVIRDKNENPDKYNEIKAEIDNLLKVNKKEDLPSLANTIKSIQIKIENKNNFSKVNVLLKSSTIAVDNINSLKNTNQEVIDSLDQLKLQIRNVFTESFRSQIFKPTYIESETELDRVMVGTVFGFGTALLSMKYPELGGFAYMGFKLYFGPVDRRLMDPYLTKLSRWSILVCLLYKSELIYKGQTLGDFWGGFKPLVGIGFDLPLPILKAISINGGFIFYSQPNINPLAAPDPKPKISIFCGLSFDFDLINRLIKMPTN